MTIVLVSISRTRPGRATKSLCLYINLGRLIVQRRNKHLCFLWALIQSREYGHVRCDNCSSSCLHCYWCHGSRVRTLHRCLKCHPNCHHPSSDMACAVLLYNSNPRSRMLDGPSLLSARPPASAPICCNDATIVPAMFIPVMAFVSSHQKKPVKIVNLTNSAKNSPISALRKSSRPNSIPCQH